MFFVALGAGRLADRFSPRLMIRVGLGAMLVGSLLLLVTIDPKLRAIEFLLSMAVLGSGLGLTFSQLGNVNLSSVGPERSSEVGGLQGTAQNLGTALGTALIGSILLGSLAGAFDRQIDQVGLSSSARAEIVSGTSTGLPFLPASQVDQELRKRGVDASQARDITDAYASAEIGALKTAIGGIAVFTLAGLALTRRLPGEPLVGPGEGAAAPPG